MPTTVIDRPAIDTGPELDRSAAAVLVSGGVDSAILVHDLLREFRRVWPIYVRFGLRWEDVELASLRRFLDAAPRRGLGRLVVLDEPIGEVYGKAHWSKAGGGLVPDSASLDEAVFLPGRNLLLLAKASVWCRLRGVGSLAIGCLGSNPFPDSTPDFFEHFQGAAGSALGGTVEILRPFDRLHKPEVLRRGIGLPLDLTFSCLDPADGLHCGSCNKCAERRRAFGDLGLPDRTAYARGLAS